MKKYNISKPENYKAKDGTEKTYWNNIGTMTEFDKPDGSISRIIEIPAISLKASIFPIVEKAQVQTETDESQEVEEKEPIIDPITGNNCDDIPF